MTTEIAALKSGDGDETEVLENEDTARIDGDTRREEGDAQVRQLVNAQKSDMEDLSAEVQALSSLDPDPSLTGN